VCQAVRLADLALVANFHATSGYAAEQVLRAAALADRPALPGEPVILCGDTNLRHDGGVAYAELQSWGFSDPAPGIDQILVRGLPSSAPTVWPEERRRVDGRLLSDHAPVELTVG
jgi:endonuclease/exonuclease/phosphatase family metal-dependent hydrolase